MDTMCDAGSLLELIKMVHKALHLHLKEGVVESDFEPELEKAYQTASLLIKHLSEWVKTNRVFFALITDDIQTVAQEHFGFEIEPHEFAELDRLIGKVGCDWTSMVVAAIERLLEK